ncbi:transmembrane protein 271 [Carettochelys insculpta]|uniref:transmembrane protein 271 n=1 Tax=Carettochelys insculpta TaxID=44489 RepID=UPI003EC08B30
MKWSVRGACAALSSCLLLACALSAAAVGLKCFSLGSELKGEPFRLGTAAGAFYSGLLLAAGLSLLASALLCCRPAEEESQGAAAAGQAGAAPPGGRQNFLLLGVLVFMLGVLSAFAGAVIDGDTVSLVERKYSHHCRPGAGPATLQLCPKLRDYQRGLVLSTVFNALECLLGLLSLLLVRNYQAARQRGRRRRRQRRRQQRPQPGGRRRRRGGAGGAGGRRAPRCSRGSVFSGGEPALSPGADCPFQAVSYINVGVFHVLDEAGVEVHGGGHPSLELPGYSPLDPELNPYCYPLPHERPPAYEEIYPGHPCANCS